MDEIDLNIGEMDCEKCANRLQGVLNGAVGIKKAEVSFDTKRATVSYRAQTIGEAEIVALVDRAGFTAQKR
jgi:P-type Cu+ transporter